MEVGVAGGRVLSLQVIALALHREQTQSFNRARRRGRAAGESTVVASPSKFAEPHGAAGSRRPVTLIITRMISAARSL